MHCTACWHWWTPLAEDITDPPPGPGWRPGRALPGRATALHRRLYRCYPRELAGRDLQLLFEPGRSIAANAGLLVTRVEYLKPTPEHNFALVDAAMNDMIRPALYQAWLDIQPVEHSGKGQRRAGTWWAPCVKPVISWARTAN